MASGDWHRKATNPEPEIQERADQRLGRASLTGGNVGGSHAPGNRIVRDQTGWLGREDSNLRMAESKSAALPLGYAPPQPGNRGRRRGCSGRRNIIAGSPAINDHAGGSDLAISSADCPRLAQPIIIVYVAIWMFAARHRSFTL